MGGGSVDRTMASGERTVVLVGRTGNGKSATANSILGRKAFTSRASSSGVTSTSELQTTELKDGQIINVIDTFIETESKLKETIGKLEQQLKEERVARMKAEEREREAEMMSNDEIRKLRENIEKAQMETEEHRKKVENQCSIL